MITINLNLVKRDSTFINDLNELVYELSSFNEYSKTASTQYEEDIFLRDITFIDDLNDKLDFYAISNELREKIWIFKKEKLIVVSISCNELDVANKYIEYIENGLSRFSALHAVFCNVEDSTLSAKENTFDYETFRLMYGEVPKFKIVKIDGQEEIDSDQSFGKAVFINEVEFSASWIMYFNRGIAESIELDSLIDKEVKPYKTIKFQSLLKVQLTPDPITEYETIGYQKMKIIHQEVLLENQDRISNLIDGLFQS